MAGEASRWAVGDAHPAVDLVDHDVVTLVYAGVDARHYLELQRRLTAEVERTRPLRGTALVSLRDCGALANGRPYFVLARVQTPPLARYLQERGALGPLPALAVAQRLLETAQLAHAQGVFLGDIRPSNVFVQEQLGADGTRVLSPQLVDIGFARGVFDGLVKLPEVPAGYRSPEVRAGTPLAAADDTYAIGSVLHFMLTGRAPRENGDTAEGLPPILDKIVSRALLARRSQRWPTAGAFLEAIEAARHVLSMPAGVQQVLRQFMDANAGLRPESNSNADLPTVQLSAGAATTRIGGTVPFDPRALAAALMGARVAQPITEGEPEADEPLTPDALRRILRVVSAVEDSGHAAGADTVPSVGLPERGRAQLGLVEPGAGPAPSDPLSRTPTGLEMQSAPRTEDARAQVTVTRTLSAPKRGTTGPLTSQGPSAAAPAVTAPPPATPTGVLPRTQTSTGALPRTPTSPATRVRAVSGQAAFVAPPPPLVPTTLVPTPVCGKARTASCPCRETSPSQSRRPRRPSLRSRPPDTCRGHRPRSRPRRLGVRSARTRTWASR
jgi:serine/threonine protein kinase